MKRPNIVFLITDQQRYDTLGCMGNSVIETPNLDGLAKEGVTFLNAYTASPVCAPARAAIFSGMYPPRCGVVGNWVPFRGDVVLFPERIQHVGYRTAEVGKLHFVPHMKRFGFQYKKLHDAPYNIYANDADYSDYVKFLQQTKYKHNPDEPVRLADTDETCFFGGNEYQFIMGSNWREEKYHSTTWTAKESIKYLKDCRRGDPFFLHVSFFSPHQPFEPPPPWNTLYKPEDIILPPQFYAKMENAPIFHAQRALRAKKNKEQWDEFSFKKIIAAYYGGIAMIDHYVGKIFDQLKAMNLWDETMIIFTTDHGDHNGQYGLFYKDDMYDSSAKVPLLIKPAHCKPSGRSVRNIVNTLDLYGTILDAARDTEWREDDIEARSLVPFLYGDTQSNKWENLTFSIIGEDPDTNLTMLRKDHLKLIRLARRTERTLYEMYNMNDKVYETRNIYDEREYEKERSEMKKILDNWWMEQKKKYPKEVNSFGKQII